MSTTFIVIVALCAFLTGFAKSGLAGLVLVVVPLLSLVIDARLAVATALPLLLVGDAFAIWTYWGKWERRYIRLMVPAGVIGTIIGSLILSSIDNTILRRIIGIMTLVYVAYRISGEFLQNLDYDPPDILGIIAGFTAGVTSSLAAAGAPPYAAYMLLKKQSPIPFMATFTLFFVISNVVKLPVFIQTGLLRWAQFQDVAWALPLIPLGIWLGRLFVARVQRVVFERMILGVLVLTGVMLLTT